MTIDPEVARFMNETNAELGASRQFQAETLRDRIDMREELRALADRTATRDEALQERADRRHAEFVHELRELRHDVRDALQNFATKAAEQLAALKLEHERRIGELERERRDWHVRIGTLRWAGAAAAAGLFSMGAWLFKAADWAIQHFRGGV